MEENKDLNKQEVYSQRVRAGKRTYFFDIKSTKGNDFYLTITESKKKMVGDVVQYDKHKLFLYKEDLDKFLEALGDAIRYMKTELLTDYDFSKVRENDDFDVEDDLRWE